MSRGKRLTTVLVAATLAITVAGCGGSGNRSGDVTGKAAGKPGGNDPTTPTPSPTPERIRGTYKAQPGQADKAQSTLTGAGFECTRHADDLMDLRLCSKGSRTKGGKYVDPGVVEGHVRFVSDKKGTIVFAAYGGMGNTGADESDELRHDLLSALLPAADVAIVEGDGETLSWGRYVKGTGTDNNFLIVNGFEPRLATPVGRPVSKLTKEQAFAKLRDELKCKFGEPIDVGGDSKANTVTCADPNFKSENEDGSIAGATSEMILRESKDSSPGLASVDLRGSHASIPDDTRAVETLLPRLRTMSDEQTVAAIADWAEKHLDGMPHSAYIGQSLVSINVVTKSMTGDSVSLNAQRETPALGLPADKGGVEQPFEGS